MFIVVIVISILLKPAFWQISIYSQSPVKILSQSDKEKSLLKRLKNTGMASEKLYRNTLIFRQAFEIPTTERGL